MQENIFDKIDAKNSYMNKNNTRNLESQPYQTWPMYRKLPNVFSTIGSDLVSAGGGIFMSIDDFENYIHKAFLGGKIFENQKTHERFLSKGFKKTEGQYYGFGLEHNDIGKYKKIYHDGGSYGYRSNITYYSYQNLVVALFFGTETEAIRIVPDEIVRCFDKENEKL